jgi:hypothetical protein
MHPHHRFRRTRFALAVPLASLALLITPALTGAGLAQAKAATCSSWTTGSPPSPGTFDNQLRGVAALSACNVWAVGDYSSNGIGQRLTLAEHWNGTSWKVVHTPSPGHINQLRAVSALSSRNIWAVGHADGSTLILHWNGRSWARVPGPTPGTGGNLNGVVAVSATSAWAVGEFSPANSQDRTLVLRWNGKLWTRAASPAAGTDSRLGAVTATSSRSAWAVGGYFSGTSGKTLILHWNGVKWMRVTSPNPSGAVTEMVLDGVSASSVGNAWAVGTYNTSTIQKTIIVRWNGRAWKIAANPSPGQEPFLFGVSAISASDAWAVGSYLGSSTTKTLIMHWDGRAWDQIVSPSPGSSSGLTSVAATSASNLWAVGAYLNGSSTSLNLAIHCC